MKRTISDCSRVAVARSIATARKAVATERVELVM
jgi:hypothetical protein